MKNVVKWLISAVLIISLFSCTAFAYDEEPNDENPFTVVGNWLTDRGKDIENAVTVVGEGISSAASATGEWISNTATGAGEGIGSAASVTGEWISNTAVATGEGIGNAALTTGEWFGDRVTDVQNAASGVADMTVSAVQNFDPTVLANPDYYMKSLQKVALGDYSDLDPTALSVAISIAASVTNLDVGMDIRDLTYAIQHLPSGEVTPAALVLDTVALVPIVGAIKNLKYADTIVDAVKVAETVTDAVSDTGKTIDTVVDVADITHDVSKTTTAIDDLHDTTKMADDAQYINNVADTINVTDQATDISKNVNLIDDAADFEKHIKKIELDVLPDKAQETFKMYEECGWDGEKALENMSEGSSAGKVFTNREELLPVFDEEGNKLVYHEYDAFSLGDAPDFDPTHSTLRGLCRFVRDNHGNVYYTDDHYMSYKLIEKVVR